MNTTSDHSRLTKAERKALEKQNNQGTTYGALAKTSYGNLTTNKKGIKLH